MRHLASIYSNINFRADSENGEFFSEGELTLMTWEPNRTTETAKIPQKASLQETRIGLNQKEIKTLISELRKLSKAIAACNELTEAINTDVKLIKERKKHNKRVLT